VSIDEVPHIRICVQGEGTGWESAFPASLTGSGAIGLSRSPTKKTIRIIIKRVPTVGKGCCQMCNC